AIHISTSLVTLYIDIIFTYSPSTPMSYRFAYTTLFRSSVMTGPVPPTMPLATPPATPRPEKSRASNFWFRSTGGISVGRSFGGTMVWKPCGGGFADTTASGGSSCGGGGGGGGGAFTTNSIGRSLSFCTASAAPWVALMATRTSTTCTTIERMACPRLRCLTGLDSIRFSNTATPPPGGQCDWSVG